MQGFAELTVWLAQTAVLILFVGVFWLVVLMAILGAAGILVHLIRWLWRRWFARPPLESDAPPD